MPQQRQSALKFELQYQPKAQKTLQELRKAAKQSPQGSRQLGLYKQVHKTLSLLEANPRYPGLQTHAYSTLNNPFNPKEKVFEAYAQNNTPSAYRVFWCYGPQSRQITIIAITPHP